MANEENAPRDANESVHAEHVESSTAQYEYVRDRMGAWSLVVSSALRMTKNYADPVRGSVEIADRVMQYWHARRSSITEQIVHVTKEQVTQ